jgi:tubulysin polyketide synthase-like protein
MTAVELLRELSARGIRVIVCGNRLSLRGPETCLTRELTERLRQYKPQILEAAGRCPKCSECGAVIAPGEPECWWGRDRVHGDCGKRAWAREWSGKAAAGDTPCAMVH